jgi:hypothetical protein
MPILLAAVVLALTSAACLAILVATGDDPDDEIHRWFTSDREE